VIQISDKRIVTN